MATKKSATGMAATAALSAMSPDVLLDLVQKLGLVDLVIGRVKSRIEETDLDEVVDGIEDYLRRNPEVLVVGMAAITIAAAVIVYLNRMREWDGQERRLEAERAAVTRTPARVGKRTVDSRRVS